MIGTMLQGGKARGCSFSGSFRGGLDGSIGKHFIDKYFALVLLPGFRLKLIFDLKGDKIRRDEVDFFNLMSEFGFTLGSWFDGDVHASIFQYLNIIIVIGFKLYFNS